MNPHCPSASIEMEIYSDGEMWCARGVGHSIFTQGHSVKELMRNIHEAVTLHFEGDVAAQDITITVSSIG